MNGEMETRFAERRLQNLESSNIDTVEKLAEHSTKLDYLADGIKEIKTSVTHMSGKMDEIKDSIRWLSIWKKIGVTIGVGALTVIGERLVIYLLSIKHF